MPQLDGLEFTRTFIQESIWQDLPIIMVSASTLPRDESECYQVGANSFLAKPLNFEQLLKLLQQHLKFEWITQNVLNQLFESSEISQIKTSSDSESVVVPTAAQLNQILELTMEGDIRELLSHIELWQQNQPQLMPFIQQIRHLAETCQLRKLKELLKQYLEHQ